MRIFAEVFRLVSCLARIFESRQPYVVFGRAVFGPACFVAVWVGLTGARCLEAAEVPVAIFSNPFAHNLYLLNADGNLFRWGEPRYGGYAGSTAQSILPYYDSVLTVPPSPSGAPWTFAAGHDQLELFIDSAGHAYFDTFFANRPVQFREITQPYHDRSWKTASVYDNHAVLIDDLGQMYSADNLNVYSSSIVAATPMIAPAAGNAAVQIIVTGYGDIVRTAAGEVYTQSWNGNWLIGGSITTSGGQWLKVPRPTGVNQWLQVNANDNVAVAKGDDGKLYYWGQSIYGSVFSGTNYQSRLSIPVAIPPPTELPAGGRPTWWEVLCFWSEKMDQSTLWVLGRSVCMLRRILP